jgi:hypothetical protein
MKNWPQIRRILRIAGTLIGMVIFGYQLYTSITALTAQKQQLQLVWGWIFLALAVYLGVYFLQMVNLWLVYKTNFPRIKLKPIVQGYAMSFLPKYTPGYIWGYLSRADWLESRAGIPGAYSWLATVLEVVVTLMSGALVLLLNWALRGGRYLLLAVVAGLLPWLTWLLMRYAARFMRRCLKEERQQVLEAFAIPFPRWALVTPIPSFNGAAGHRAASGQRGLLYHAALLSGLRSGSMFTPFVSLVGGLPGCYHPNGLCVRETVLNALLESQLGFVASAAVVISVASRSLLPRRSWAGCCSRC